MHEDAARSTESRWDRYRIWQRFVKPIPEGVDFRTLPAFSFGRIGTPGSGAFQWEVAEWYASWSTYGWRCYVVLGFQWDVERALGFEAIWNDTGPWRSTLWWHARFWRWSVHSRVVRMHQTYLAKINLWEQREDT